MNISLNLDNYLKQFPSLNFCDDLLKTYYKDRDADTVQDSSDNEIFAYRTEPTQEHYKTLLNEEYDTIYHLVDLYIPSGDTILSWSDWYYIASNAYKMKGVLASFQYVLDYLNMDPRVEGNITYEILREHQGNDVHRIQIHVPVASRNADLTRNYLEKLARELLIVDDITARFTELEFDIVIEFTSAFNQQWNHIRSTFINFWDLGVKNVIRRPVIDKGTAITYIDMQYKDLYHDLNVGTIHDGYYRVGNIFNPFLTWANLQRMDIKIPNVVIDFVKQIKPEIEMPEMKFMYKAREVYKITPVYGRKDLIKNQLVSDFQFKRHISPELITVAPVRRSTRLRMSRRGPILSDMLNTDEDNPEDSDDR